MIDPSIYGGVPLPRHEDYEIAFVQTVQSERIDSHGSMESAMDRAGSRDSAYKRFMGLMAQVGMWLEPLDQTTGKIIDYEQKTVEAIVLGSALGGLVVPKVHRQIAPLDTLKINLPKRIWESGNTLDAKNMLSEYLFEYGDYGLSVIGNQAEEVLEETETLVIEDVTKQRMFRIGCGIVIHAITETHTRYNQEIAEADRRQLADSLDNSSDLDWDSELDRLLKMKDE